MQVTTILDTILGNPIFLIAIFWVVGIVIAIAIYRRSKGTKETGEPKLTKRPKIKVKGRLMKQMQKIP